MGEKAVNFDDVKYEIHGLHTRTLTSHELEMFAEKVWIAVQDNIIKRAWEVFGEDFADDLMEIVDRKVRPEWGEE